MKPLKAGSRRQEIVDAYFAYFDAYTSRKWDDMNKHLMEGITMFGTAIDEVSFDGEKTRATLKREFLQSGKPIKYKVTGLEVYEFSERVAMLMITLDLQLFSKDQLISYPNNRTTALMVKEADGWKLAHGHWSQPDKDIDVGESVPYTLLLKRSRELEEKIALRTREIESQASELKNLNNTKDKLFSVIAHDLKNPFNSILGFSSLLKDSFADYEPEEAQSMLGTIHNQAVRTYDLLENLLQWAKSQTNMISFRPVRLPLMDMVIGINDHLSVMSNEKDVVIHNEVGNDVVVYADKDLLQIIMRNLLHNAIKYTRKKGNIWVKAVLDDQVVRVSVVDDGVGLEKELMENLEEGGNCAESLPGTANETGNCLGLFLCREFISKHGSRLVIDSKPGEGSCFSFNLESFRY